MGRRVRTRDVGGREPQTIKELYPISFSEIRAVILEDGREVQVLKAGKNLFTILCNGKIETLENPNFMEWKVIID